MPETTPSDATTIQTVRIAQETPAIFIDTVMSHSYAFGVSKLYLGRTDPDPAVIGPSKEVVVLQVVMPTGLHPVWMTPT
jgi:hypothetical protein